MDMVGSALLIPESEIASAHVPVAIPEAERVVIKLHGRCDDVRSAAERLRIDLDWGRAERLPDEACSVDGRLALAESPRLFI